MNDNKKILENIKEMQKMNDKEWESICNNCGACCMAKIDIYGKRYFSNNVCKFYDKENKACSCYKNRLVENPDCTKIILKEVIKGGLLPDSCAYVEKIFGPAKYPANPDWDKIEHIQGIINKNIDKIADDIIPESDFWLARFNYSDEEIPGYSEIKNKIIEFIKKKRIRIKKNKN